MSKALSRPSPGELTARVYSRIREQIGQGSILPGQCVPSERELGIRLKVSRVTVRRGLDQLVREGLLRREPSRGYFVPSPDAAAGNGGSGGKALVFLHNHSEAELATGTYHARMWAGAREEATRHGFITLISSLPADALTAAKTADLSRIATGVLCDHPAPCAIQALLHAGIPTVQVDYPRDEMAVDTVVQDDMRGVLQAVHHLFDHGHRRIGYLDGCASLRAMNIAGNTERRRAGFLQACDRLGISPAHIAPGDYATGDAASSVRQLLAAGITALVVPHSEFWPSARTTLAAAGVAIPGPFGIVVWGDGGPATAPNNFPSSIAWSKEQMGRESVRRLMARLERPDLEPATILVPTRLIDRQTGGQGPGNETNGGRP